MYKIIFLIFIFCQISSFEFDEFGEESAEALVTQIGDFEPLREMMLVEEDENESVGNFEGEESEGEEEGTTAFYQHFGLIRSDGAAFGDDEGEMEEEGEGVKLEEEEWGKDDNGSDGGKRDMEEEEEEEEESKMEEWREGEEQGGQFGRTRKESKCENGWLSFKDEVCFNGLSAQKDFYSGVGQCGQLNANFTSIHSVEEFKFITSHWDLRHFWVGIFYGKSHFEDGTAVDRKVLRQIAPLVPWATPDKLKGFICRKDPKEEENMRGGKEAKTDETADGNERVGEEKTLRNTTEEEKLKEISETYENMNKSAEMDKNSEKGADNRSEVEREQQKLNSKNISGRRIISEIRLELQTTFERSIDEETVKEGTEQTHSDYVDNGNTTGHSENKEQQKSADKLDALSGPANSETLIEYSAEIVVEGSIETFAETASGASNNATEKENEGTNSGSSVATPTQLLLMAITVVVMGL